MVPTCGRVDRLELRVLEDANDIDVTAYHVGTALREGGCIHNALVSPRAGERNAACRTLRSALHAVLSGPDFKHTCVTADDMFITDDGTVIVLSDNESRSSYESVYNPRGDVQLAYSLATSLISALGHDAYGGLCENLKCFLQASLMHAHDALRGSLSECGGTAHEAPVSSGVGRDTALAVLAADMPSRLTIRSPPTLDPLGAQRGHADTPRLLAMIEQEAWPPELKAQARRAVTLTLYRERKGSGGLTEADIIPEGHTVWGDHSAVCLFNATETPRRLLFTPRPVRV
jgi:hypothetical protein